MIEYLNDLDSQLLICLKSFNSGFLDWFMLLVTDKVIWVPFYVSLACLLFIYKNWKVALIWLVAIGIIIVLSDQICAHLIRPVVARLRPTHENNPISNVISVVDNYRAGGYSFPSCHAANSAAFATIICMLIKRWDVRLLICTWAILHIYSRIYLGLHYPGDILAGMIIGILIALAIYYIVRYLIHQIPILHDARQSFAYNPVRSKTGTLNFYPGLIPWTVFILTILYIIIGFFIG